MEIFWLKNHTSNVVHKLFLDLFLNLVYLWINNLKINKSLYILCAKLSAIKIILKSSCRPLSFTSYKAFLKNKNKKGFGTSLSTSFSVLSLKKNIYNIPLWDIGQNVYCNCQPGCDVINFGFKLIFLMKLFLLYDQNVKTKILISWERKEHLRWNKKHFSSILKDYDWSK